MTTDAPQMNQCDTSARVASERPAPGGAFPSIDEMQMLARDLGDGVVQSDVVVDDVHCGACIRKIEKGLAKVESIKSARLNLSTGWLAVQWEREKVNPALLFSTLKNLGYSAHLAEDRPAGTDPVLKELLISLAVAGFAAANIMLLSVSVWSGAEAATRDLFHWISALLAIPAVAIAGRPFFRPAWKAITAGRLNMDVPISLAVILALLMSIYETANSGENAYFDASVTLLFFLLIGRTLDHVMRARARGAVKTLLRMMPRGAIVTTADNKREYVRLEAIEPGMRILVPLGERVPVDGRIVKGESEFDCSIVNGESIPAAFSHGDRVQAGTLNLTAPVEIEATASAENSFVAEITAMMEAAESGKQKYRRIADRAASIYAPAVHFLAFSTFVGWMVASGDWRQATYAAVAVLIITCPCALGLAVPIVQVVAAGKLFGQGIMVKDGVALEKLADVDYAVFDKTGTLTIGNPLMANFEGHAIENLKIARSLAGYSHHPYSQSIVDICEDKAISAIEVSDVTEIAGNGIEGRIGDDKYRLGRAGWADYANRNSREVSGVVLARNGKIVDSFCFVDHIRPAARQTFDALEQQGVNSEILSGDHRHNVARIADALGGVKFSAGVSPSQKVDRVKALSEEGKFVLMVGDGINDAPALASAHVSIAPASAADVGRSVSDLIFLRDGLDAVTRAIAVSKLAKKLIQQNFGLAIAYNFVAVPLAVMGYATPLVAALAMSSSSILVTLNALRLKLALPGEKQDKSEVSDRHQVRSLPADLPALERGHKA